MTDVGAAADSPFSSLEASPDSPQLADAAAAWRSVYVHIPFCRRRCPYCDFAVVTEAEGGTGAMVDRYVRAVVSEIEAAPEWAPLDAVNFGGGTPSTLAPSLLAAILRALRARYGLVGDAEVSLEANPEDWSESYGTALAGLGFTRVSFGVQSFDARTLGALGRLHAPEQGRRAVEDARAAGFTSIGLDLIFGTPGESAEVWAGTVEAALELDIDHLSAYALTVERGTELSRAVAAGAPAPDPDAQADAWEHLAAAARQSGMVRYEVSNHAGVGHACRYNLGTWAQGEYLGFGLGAHSHVGGVRRRNVRRLDRYLEQVEAAGTAEAGREELDLWGREVERVYLGLRRVAGVRPGEAGRRLVESEGGRRLLDAGVIALRSGRLVVMRPLLTDEVARSLLSLSPREC